MDTQPRPGSSTADYIVPVGGNAAHPLPTRDEHTNPLTLRNRLSWASWKLVWRRTWADFFLNAMMDRGAVQAFFMLLTFAPTVLAAYSIATLVLARNEQQVTALIDEFIQDYVPEEIADNARGVMDIVVGSSAQGTAALIFSVLFALFSSSAWVRAFARSANIVYGRVEGRTVVPTWLTMWGLTIVIVVGGVLVLGAFLLQESIIRVFVEPFAEPLGLTGTVDFLLGVFLPIWAWLRWPVVTLLGAVVLAVLFYFSPNVRPSRFRWLTFGSAFSIVTIAGVWWLFGQYLSLFAGSNAYGALGTVLAVFIAMWIMNVVLVIGVKLDAEVLRAKELQLGYDSERTIQAPPRSSKASLHYARTQKQLEDAARAIKEKHNRA